MNSFTTVQFEHEYDVHKMRRLVDDLERQFRALGLEVESTGANVHNNLSGRSAADAHPISAISGLQAALNLKANQAALIALGVIVATNTAEINVINVELDQNRLERYFLGE